MLAFRTARAFVALFAATVCLAAAPSQVDLMISSHPVGQSPSYVTSIHWQFLGVGLLLLFSSLYALRLSARYRLFKMSQRDKKTTASNSTKGKSTEMV